MEEKEILHFLPRVLDELCYRKFMYGIIHYFNFKNTSFRSFFSQNNA